VPLYVDMKKEVRVADPNHPSNIGVENIFDMVWEVEQADDQFQKVAQISYSKSPQKFRPRKSSNPKIGFYWKCTVNVTF
jgi:hypothetical protein